MNNLHINISADAESILKSAPIGVELIDRTQAFLSRKYDFRYNEVTGRIEFKLKAEVSYRIVKDKDENTIWSELQKNKLICPISFLKQVLLSDFVTMHDPFKAYLTELAPWDGKTNHIQELANTVQTTNKPFWEKYLIKWLVSMVATLLDPRVVNQSVLVFVGGQGIGKTTWIERLVPKELKEYLFTGTIDINSKDTMVLLSECMLVNLDELENLGRSGLGTLKSIITLGQIKVRRPYARNAETIPRRASFAGSINNRQFLSDSTGERRFLTFDVEKIDLDKSIPIDKVLSQALSLYKSNFRYWLNSEENDEVTASNTQYQKATIEEELLLNFFEPVEEADPEAEILQTTEILMRLKDQFNLHDPNGSLRRFGQALTKHKFSRKKKGQVYKWVVKIRKPLEVAHLQVA